MYRSALDGSGLMMLNKKLAEIFGYEPAELLGKPVINLWADARARQAMIQQLQTSGMVTDYEAEIVAKDGSIKTVLASSKVYPAHGYIEGSILDITPLKQAEADSRLWANVIENAEWGVAIGNPDGQTIDAVNPAFAKMHGYTADEFMDIAIKDLFTPEYRDQIPEYVRLAHENGHHTFESEQVRKDGSVFPVLVNVTAVKDENGNLLYRVVNVQDITLRKQFEQQLKRFATILEVTTDFVAMSDWQGKGIFVNQAGRAMMGFDPDEDITQLAISQYHPEWIHAFLDETVLSLTGIQCIPGNLHVSIHGISADMLVSRLKGLAFSTGSACASTDQQLSHVLKAVGVDPKWGGIRLGLGRTTTDEQVRFAAGEIIREVTVLRS